MSGSSGAGGAKRTAPSESGVAIEQIIHGKYALKRDLGSRGSGSVFEAEHAFTGRRVVVRLGEERRVLALARRLSGARHPGIADVLDAGPASPGRAYLVTELVEGRTLEGLLTTRGRFSKEDSIGIALQLCDALTVAHARDVFHGRLGLRDVFVVREGANAERVKLVGFLASSTDELARAGAALDAETLVEETDPHLDVIAVARTLSECLLGIRAAPLAPLTAQEREKLGAQHGVDLASVLWDALGNEGRFATVTALRAGIEAAAGAQRATGLLKVPPVPRPVPPPSRGATGAAAAPRPGPAVAAVADAVVPGPAAAAPAPVPAVTPLPVSPPARPRPAVAADAHTPVAPAAAAAARAPVPPTTPPTPVPATTPPQAIPVAPAAPAPVVPAATPAPVAPAPVAPAPEAPARAPQAPAVLAVPAALAPAPPAVPPTPAAAPGRRFRRGSYTTPVRIVLSGGQVLDGRSEDVSEGGMLVIAARDCPLEQPLELRFALPMDGKIVTLPATAKWARAARPEQPEGPRALGIEFRELPDAPRRSITRYVELLGDPAG